MYSWMTSHSPTRRHWQGRYDWQGGWHLKQNFITDHCFQLPAKQRKQKIKIWSISMWYHGSWTGVFLAITFETRPTEAIESAKVNILWNRGEKRRTEGKKKKRKSVTAQMCHICASQQLKEGRKKKETEGGGRQRERLWYCQMLIPVSLGDRSMRMSVERLSKGGATGSDRWSRHQLSDGHDARCGSVEDCSAAGLSGSQPWGGQACTSCRSLSMPVGSAHCRHSL